MKLAWIILITIALFISGCQTKDEQLQEDEQLQVNNCPNANENLLISISYPSSPGGFGVIYQIHNDGGFFYQEGIGPISPPIKRSIKISSEDILDLKNQIQNFDWQNYEIEESKKISDSPSAYTPRTTLKVGALEKQIEVTYNQEDLPDFFYRLILKYKSLSKDCE